MRRRLLETTIAALSWSAGAAANADRPLPAGEVPLVPSEGPIFEVACHEGNLGLANILSGYRAEERAVANR